MQSDLLFTAKSNPVYEKYRNIEVLKNRKPQTLVKSGQVKICGEPHTESHLRLHHFMAATSSKCHKHKNSSNIPPLPPKQVGGGSE